MTELRIELNLEYPVDVRIVWWKEKLFKCQRNSLL
jgi:hypothetical protein